MSEMKVLCLLGASGSGKSTISAELVKQGIPALVSHRTRPIREGEVHGVDGYFVSMATFDEYEERDAFCAKTIYAGNKYGLGWKELEHFRMLKKEVVSYVVDAPGLISLRKEIKAAGKEKEIEVIAVGVMASMSVMEERLHARDRDEEKVARRVSQMEKDIYDVIHEVDYLVANDTGNLSRAVSQIRELV